MTRSPCSWVFAAVAVASLIVYSPPLARADLIGSAPVSAPGVPDPSAAAPASSSVAACLRAQGLEESEISARMAQLLPSDLDQLADSPQQMQLAGSCILMYTGLAALAIGMIVGVLLLIDSAASPGPEVTGGGT